MADLAEAAFPGIGTCLGCEFTYSRGVTPSVCTLFMLPQETLNLPPGTLTITLGSSGVSFPDMAINSAYLRRRYMGGHLVWSIQLYDRRWRWVYGTLSGEYNRRMPDGRVDPKTRKTPKELMELCLKAMGESGYDLSRAPTGVFPYVNWQQVNPALALADLCDLVACEVVLNIQNSKVSVWPLGTGTALPGGGTFHYPTVKHAPRQAPKTIEVHCGPTVFQSALELNAVGRQVNDGQGEDEAEFLQKKIDDLEYEPPGGWDEDLPISFPNVTDDADRVHAFDTVWRQYKVVGQDGGGLEVPNCEETIESVDQYVLNDYILEGEEDLDEFVRILPPYVEGEFWRYCDCPDSGDQRFLGDFKLLKDRRMVEFPYPLFGLAAGVYEQPDITLTTSYRVKDKDGKFVGIVRSANAGGLNGTLILKRPHIFAAFGEEIDTEEQANEEADKYLELFKKKHEAVLASETSYAGILPGELDGIIAQARWSCAVNRPATTLVCEHEELDVSNLGRDARRRREILRRVAEELA